MTTMRKRAVIAIGIGACLSIVLAVLSASLRIHWLFFPQIPGRFTCALIWGVHGDGGNLFWAVMVSVNTVIYAVVTFGLFTSAASFRKR